MSQRRWGKVHLPPALSNSTQPFSIHVKKDNILLEASHQTGPQQRSISGVHTPLINSGTIPGVDPKVQQSVGSFVKYSTKEYLASSKFNTLYFSSNGYDLLELPNDENSASPIKYYPSTIALPAPPADYKFPKVKTGVPSTRNKGNGKDIFLEYIKNPKLIPRYCAYWSNDEHIIIYDRYPKSAVHLLIMPRIRLEDLKDLTKANHGIEIIQGLESLAKSLISERLSVDFPNLTFKFGFHAIPSMK
ncbi:hypothetical protein BGZ76_004891 [Entomortierella beljakovae]|nr:hypothetical protein BGZ76_004891 [Entomortierella beljakovae]